MLSTGVLCDRRMLSTCRSEPSFLPSARPRTTMLPSNVVTSGAEISTARSKPRFTTESMVSPDSQ